MKNFSKSILALSLMLFLFTVSAYSQNKTEGISIKGVVLDKSNGEPLESATVQVFKTDDSTLVNGASSDKSGKFTVTGLEEGSYTVKLSYIGYSTAVAKNVKANREKKEINLGTVKLESSLETTQEIEVVDEAPIMTMENGKKVYDVKKDLTSQNGNALDLLKNIPSVDVDNDGNVSLRGGGNVKILIDGKPSALLSNGTQVLQNIPANVIEKVEIITNPSAKYDAEGNSGIINILMKQGQNTGYNGNIKANGGTEDKYNLSLGGSIKKGKFTINANYSYWNYLMPGRSEIYRTIYPSITSRNVNTNLNWHFKGISHFGSFGMDYDFDKNNSLSLVTNAFFFKRNISSINTLNIYDQNNNLTGNTITNMDDGRDGYNVDATLTYTKKYEQKGRELTSFVNYSGRNENSPTHYINNINNITSLQDKFSNFKFNFFNGQADYTHPFSEKSKLETGLKSNARFIDGYYNFKSYENITGNWIPIPGKDNDANYKDVVSAFYGTYSGNYKDLSYQAGIRAEHTYIDFSIMQGTQKFNNSYFDLFPSFSFSQKLGTENQFQLSYSRRINRPGLFMLNPFVDQFDEYTKRSGNPYLKPEYIHSVELGYTRYLKFATLTLSGFYRRTNDVINYLSNVDSSGVSFSKPENRGISNTAGLEFILQGNLAKWWTLNGSASYFSTNLYNNTGVNDFDKTYNAWTTRFSTNASLPNIADIQLTYFYFGKQVNAQGTIQPMQMINVSVQKNFFEKKLTVGLRVNDLFNQQKFNLSANGTDFTQTIFQKTNSRAFFMTLTYNFGEQGNSKSQRNSQRKQREVENEIQQTGN